MLGWTYDILAVIISKKQKTGKKPPRQAAYLGQLLVFMLILLRQYARICPSLRTTER
jgi:hypothetical protein